MGIKTQGIVMNVICVGTCPQVIENAMRRTAPPEIALEFSETLSLAVKGLASGRYEACIILNANALPLLKVVQPKISLLFTPEASEIELRDKAQQLGISQCYYESGDLSKMMNFLQSKA
jgi:hypothetical protein